MHISMKNCFVVFFSILLHFCHASVFLFIYYFYIVTSKKGGYKLIIRRKKNRLIITITILLLLWVSYEINLFHWSQKKNPNFFHLLDKVFCLKLFVCFINTSKLSRLSWKVISFLSVNRSSFSKLNIANLIRLNFWID